MSVKNPCLAVLEGHTGWVTGALETKYGRFLSWADDKTLRLWDRDGQALGSDSIDAGLHNYPKFRIAYYGKENNISQNCFLAIDNSGCLSTFTEAKEISIFWHGESKCSARHLKPDGRAILTQDNGQVCFLRIYYGNKPISVKELENLSGMS